MAISVLGLAVRLGYVFVSHYHQTISGDAFYYHYGANLLADGKGYLQPYDYFWQFKSNPGADHPPLYVTLLALGSFLGGRSFTAHQVLSCLIGTSTIALTALTAKRILSPGAGIAAALIVALYPNFWLNDGVVMSEGLAQTTTALTMLCAYAFWQKPSMKWAVWVGISIALAALTRAELILFLPLIALPLILRFKQFPWRRRLSLALVTAAAAAVVIAPWVGYNLSRFDKRVYISAGLPTAMMSSSCDIGWYGPLRGYWSMQCFEAVPTKYEDASRQAVLYSNYVRSYYKAHLSDLPVVEVARVGRLWGWYRPSQMLTLEAPEGRSVPWSRVALVMLYSLEIAAFPGLFVLRRRKVPVSPLLGTCLTVTITALMVCGETRFRAPAEVAVVLLAVAGLHGLREHVIRRPSRDDVQQPEAGRGQPEGPTTAIEPRAWWK